MNRPAPEKDISIIPLEVIERRIYIIRSQKVMLSPDLAELYQVEPRALIQAVKRNSNRFPEDFMFQLTKEEADSLRFHLGTSNLKSHNVISSWGGARRATPYAFTEHGVAMLSSILNSTRAVQMNILIIRTFVKLREILATHKDLAERIEKVEVTQEKHASVITLLAEEIDNLTERPPELPKGRMGFAV